MKSFILLLACSLCFAIPVSAEYYNYVDENGVRHFTENLADIPEKFRPDMGIHKSIDSPDAQEPENSEQATEPAGDPAQTDEAEITFEMLVNKKESLEKDYAALSTKRQALNQKKENLEPEIYNTEVEALNQDIQAYQKERDAYRALVTKYNEQVIISNESVTESNPE